MNKLLGILLLIISINILIEPKFVFRGAIVDYSAPYLLIPIVSFFLISGFRILFYEFHSKYKK